MRRHVRASFSGPPFAPRRQPGGSDGSRRCPCAMVWRGPLHGSRNSAPLPTTEPMRLLQVTEAIPSSPWEMVTHATLVTKLILILLAVLSLVSWTIMFLKWREFRALANTSRSFMTEFEHQKRLVEAQGLARRSIPNPFTRVFERAVGFLPENRPSDAYDAPE